MRAQGFRRSRTPLRLAVLFVFSLTAWGQATAVQRSAPSAAQELESRLATASAAQQSGNPEAIVLANKRILAFALARMAELRLMQAAIPASVELYKRSIGYEDTLEAHLGLALADQRAGQIDDALKEVGTVVGLDPKSAAAWNLQGKLFMMKKEYRQAADALAKSLARQADMEVAYTMATALLNLHETEKAAAVFQQMAAYVGERADLHIMAARAYEGAGLPEDAEREYKRAIAIDAKSSRGHYFLGLYYLMKNGWETTPQARQEFLAEVAENPTDFFGNYFMGYITSTEKNYEESGRYLKLAAAAKPDWPEPYLYMGLNAYGQSYNRHAEELLRTAIKLTGSDETRNNYQIRRAYFTLGRILIQSGNKEEGTALIHRSREMETKLVLDSRQQALATKDAVAGAGAQSSAAEQATVAPASPAPISDPAAPLDTAALKAANMTVAEKAQTEASERQLRPIIASAFNDLGTTEARRKDYGLALAHFQDAERWYAETPGLMRNIGLAAFFSRNYTESARALKVVVAQNPQDGLAQSMLAMSLYSIRNYPEAVRAFDQVGEAAMRDPLMAYGWALSLARTNDRTRASAILDKLTAQSIPAEMLAPACQLYADIGEQAKAQACLQKQKEPLTH